VYNEGLAHLDWGGNGIRYFSFLNGVKSEPQQISTCCEGQGTRLYGSLQEYLFSTTPNYDTLFFDIYAPSSFTAISGLNASVDTLFPYGTAVSISLSFSTPGSSLVLALRIPAWVAAPSVSVMVDGKAWGELGLPGSYLLISAPPSGWPQGSTLVSFSLPMAFKAHLYTGITQIEPFTRYGFTYGPILMAALPQTWNSTLKSLHIPGVDGNNPAKWAVPSIDSHPAHFDVLGVPGITFMPNWEVRVGPSSFLSIYTHQHSHFLSPPHKNCHCHALFSTDSTS